MVLVQPSTGIDRWARSISRRSPSAIARTRSSPTPATAASAPFFTGMWAAAGTARRTAGALGVTAGLVGAVATPVSNERGAPVSADTLGWSRVPLDGAAKVELTGASAAPRSPPVEKLWKKWVAVRSDVVA